MKRMAAKTAWAKNKRSFWKGILTISFQKDG